MDASDRRAAAVPGHRPGIETGRLEPAADAAQNRDADQLRWYFEQVQSHPAPSRSNDFDERSYEAREAFSAPRLEALYKVWKQNGERALTGACSRVISEAVDAGAGRVETLEVGHRYGHLSLLVVVA